VDSPLKAALTGLELLVARAQLWQTTAAKHVSLDPQLQAVTALAGRWRRLELASWRRLLARTIDSYAKGVWLCKILVACNAVRGMYELPVCHITCTNKGKHALFPTIQPPPPSNSTHNSPLPAETPLGGPSPALHVFFIPFSAILAKIKCSICSDQFDR